MAREMKNSGVRWIGDIPSNWGMSKFKAEGSVLSGFPFNSEKFTSDTGFPLIRIRDITSGQAGTFYDGDYPTSYIIHDGDFLLGMDGEFNVRWWQGGDALLNQRCCRLSLNNKFFAKYIFYLIPFGLKLINDLAYSTTVKHLSVPDILNLSLLVPPLAEQKVIADFLDAKCGEIDGLLADLEAEVKTLTEYKKSIIAETVTRGLNPNAPMKASGIPWAPKIPVHWKVMANKYLMHKEKEIVPKYEGQPIISLSMNGVIVRDLDAGGKMPTSFDGYQHIKPGNLLMCLFDIDVTPRCIGLIKNDGLTSPAYSQFAMKEEAYTPYYYYFYLKMDNAKELVYLSKNMRHSLNEDQFGALQTILPPKDEQIEIAKYLDSKCAAIDQAITDKTQQIETLKAYKSSLIYEYVTGKKQVAI